MQLPLLRALTLATVLILPSPCDAQRSAAPSHASHSGPPAGARPAAPLRADTVAIQSRILGQERFAFVSVPESWARTTRTYPVVLVLDGEWSFPMASELTRRLALIGHAPEAIVVGVANLSHDPMDRVHDMTPPGLSVSGSSMNEGGDDFLDYLERELLPLVRERWRGAGPVILVGHSSGALIATYAAATRPRSFPVVVSIDAPVHLGDDWMVQRMLEGARAADAPPLRYVSLEARLGWTDATWAQLERAKPASWRTYRDRLEGESHESMDFLGIYEGLKFAFADYSIVGAPIPPRGSAMGAFDHYRRIEQEFGSRLPPPPSVLSRLVEDLLTEGRVEPARTALAWLVDGYGETTNRAELEAMIARVAALPPLEETVEDLRAAPRATAAQMRPFVGEWRGQGTINGNTVYRGGLRVRIDGDSVIAEIIDSGGGEDRMMPVDYLRVVPGGFEFGRMNGMRPLGMVVTSVRRDGDAMVGEQTFRGIVLPLPGGHMPPTVRIRLERQ